jgi:hypothetical protein
MADQDFFNREIKSLNESDQEKVAEYIRFLKVKNVFQPENERNYPKSSGPSQKEIDEYYKYSI